MKVCEKCGVEISTRDGENLCPMCEENEGKRNRRNEAARKARKARAEIMESLGLKRVRGALGGVYWE